MTILYWEEERLSLSGQRPINGYMHANDSCFAEWNSDDFAQPHRCRRSGPPTIDRLPQLGARARPFCAADLPDRRDRPRDRLSAPVFRIRSEEHTSELQSRLHLV